MSDELKQEGLSLFRQRLYPEAVAKFEAAAEAYQQNGNATGRLEMVNNIGVVRRMERDWPSAFAALDEARQGFAEIGDQSRQAQALANTGDVYGSRSEWEEAARYYSDAAELFARAEQTTEHRAMHSQVLRALSLARLRQRRWIEAMTIMEQSLAARPQLDPLSWLFRGLIRLALRLFGGG